MLMMLFVNRVELRCTNQPKMPGVANLERRENTETSSTNVPKYERAVERSRDDVPARSRAEPYRVANVLE